MEKNQVSASFNKPIDNFFIKNIAANAYADNVQKFDNATKPPKRKVYRDLNKMLQECYLVGSLKYGNNFIV